MRNLVPFVQLKRREKHPWRSVTFSKAVDLRLKPATFTYSNTPPWVLFMFFKLYKFYENVQRITMTFIITQPGPSFHEVWNTTEQCTSTVQWNIQISLQTVRKISKKAGIVPKLHFFNQPFSIKESKMS